MTASRSIALLIAAVVLAACGGSDPAAEVSDGGEDSGAAAPGASADADDPEASSDADAPETSTDGDGPDVSDGDGLPELEVDAFDGERVALTDYVGTPLVVNFWASWCPPCIAEMPDLEAVHGLADGRVTFVGVNTQDTPERAAELVDETGVTYDLVRDPDAELFQALGVFGMPTTFYVDADGAIIARHTGLLTREALLTDLQEHLGVDVAAAP